MGNGKKEQAPGWRRYVEWVDVSILVIVGLGVVIICWIARGRFCLEITVGYVLAALICAAQKVKAIIGALTEDDPPPDNVVGHVEVKNKSGKYLKRLRVRRKTEPNQPIYRLMEDISLLLPDEEDALLTNVPYQGSICALRVHACLGETEDPLELPYHGDGERDPVPGEDGLRIVRIVVRPPPTSGAPYDVELTTEP